MKKTTAQGLFSRKRMLIAAGISSYLTILCLAWWAYHMRQTGSAIDWYPGEWINSLAFVSVTVLGSLSGGLFVASLFPWSRLRAGVLVLLAVGVPIGFHATKRLWFENCDTYYTNPKWWYVLEGPALIGVAIVALGWLLSLVVFPFFICARAWAKHRK